MEGVGFIMETIICLLAIQAVALFFLLAILQANREPGDKSPPHPPKRPKRAKTPEDIKSKERAAKRCETQRDVMRYGLFGVKPNEKEKAQKRR